MEVVDVDGNGIIDYGEFFVVIFYLNKIECDENMFVVFLYLDKDNSGYLMIDEF